MLQSRDPNQFSKPFYIKRISNLFVYNCLITVTLNEETVMERMKVYPFMNFTTIERASYYMARAVFSILFTVRLYTVMPEVCRWMINEKQRKTDIRLTDQ